MSVGVRCGVEAEAVVGRKIVGKVVVGQGVVEEVGSTIDTITGNVMCARCIVINNVSSTSANPKSMAV